MVLRARRQESDHDVICIREIVLRGNERKPTRSEMRPG